MVKLPHRNIKSTLFSMLKNAFYLKILEEENKLLNHMQMKCYFEQRK